MSVNSRRSNFNSSDEAMNTFMVFIFVSDRVYEWRALTAAATARTSGSRSVRSAAA